MRRGLCLHNRTRCIQLRQAPQNPHVRLRRVEVVSSVAILALQFLLHASPEAAAPLRAPLVAALVPWAMHHNHGVKTLSLLVLKVPPPAPADPLSSGLPDGTGRCPGDV